MPSRRGYPHRKLLGHAMSSHHDADLTSASLLMAVARRGVRQPGTVFYSVRGGECIAGDYAAVCAKVGVTQSMAAWPTGPRWARRT